MKRKVLAMLVPALLVAGAANAAEIYNKNGNKLDLYGKMVGERILTDRENGEKGDNSQDTSYARVGVKGETQINPELTGYGQFELDLEGHCCKVSDEAAFCLIQRPYISKTLLTRRISPRGSP